MPTPDSSLLALIKLLADDHPEVVEAARAKLTELGEAAVPFLERAAASDFDSKIRVEALSVLERIRLKIVGEDWQRVAAESDDRLDLEQGTFLLARVRYPDLDPRLYQRKLDVLAARVRPRLARAAGPRQRLEALNQVLFQAERFQGNWRDYFDPENSYLNCVLDRKLGIPISLSVLYLLVARRVKLPVQGVGVPGHFMVKYKDDRTEFFVDPFNAGRFLSRPECVQFLVEAGYPYQAEFMEGLGPREILARMLRNLILIYMDRHEQTLEKTLTRFLDLLYREREGPGRGGIPPV